MAITEERRKWIESVALGSVYEDLPEEEFEELTDEDFEQPSREFFASVTDPEELHVFVSAYNWDGGVEDLQRVIRHPLCDLGTALLVFWLGTPAFYYIEHPNRDDAPDYGQATWDLLHEIESRVTKGEYRTATQPFDPKNYSGTDWRPSATEIEQHGRDIPAVMYQAVVSLT